MRSSLRDNLVIHRIQLGSYIPRYERGDDTSQVLFFDEEVLE